MFIFTIATDGWVDTHLRRWERCVRTSNPDARLGLVLVSGRDRSGEPLIKRFDKVACYGEEGNNRRFWNAVRMMGVEAFWEDRVIYCDCDADIVGDLGWVWELAGEWYVRSPAVHGWWRDECGKRGWGVWEANNGFLVMTRDWVEEYKKKEKEAIECGAPGRIAGLLSFNLLVRSGGWRELPYKAGVVWWDLPWLKDADVIQWCNDEGQERRLELERLRNEAMKRLEKEEQQEISKEVDNV